MRDVRFSGCFASTRTGTPTLPSIVARLRRETASAEAGTLLVREWNGRLERVMILEEGFAWNGHPPMASSSR